MKKKYEIKKYIFLLILTILLIVIFTSTNMVKNISNLYNIIIENILITKDKNMITDDMTKTYIKDLEKQNNELLPELKEKEMIESNLNRLRCFRILQCFGMIHLL